MTIVKMNIYHKYFLLNIENIHIYVYYIICVFVIN